MILPTPNVPTSRPFTITTGVLPLPPKQTFKAALLKLIFEIKSFSFSLLMSFLLDSESPSRSNVSGVTALDDSQDMSVVIRVCLSFF